MNRGKNEQQTEIYKDVVIIGNGPSGICLSYLLSGNWPHYTGAAHPADEILTARLRYSVDTQTNAQDFKKIKPQRQCCQNSRDNHSSTCLQQSSSNKRACKKSDGSSAQPDEADEDDGCFAHVMNRTALDDLSVGLEGRNGGKPLSLLMDQLQHPCLDAGLDVPSLLTWRSKEEHRSHKVIDHVVLGKGPPGGSWHTLDPNVLTVSLKRWMSLPGLDLREWDSNNETKQNGFTSARVLIGTVANYYKDYVQRYGLEKNFRCGTVVTSVRPVSNVLEDDKEYGWLVEGFENDTNQTFRYRCKNVVLASGTTDSTNHLGVIGEDLYNWVSHDLKDFERKLDGINFTLHTRLQINDQFDVEERSKIEPVLIVGSGLSAADAIMAARCRGIPVLHVFRNSSKKNSQSNDAGRNRSLDKLQWLPASVYPEYHKVYEMMANELGRNYPLYKSLPDHVVIEFSAGTDRYMHSKTRRVTLCTPQNRLVSYRISYAAILIGSKPDLSFLQHNGIGLGRNPEKPIDSRSNPIGIDVLTYEVERAPRKGLHAIGPLAGDNFVRFILGGAFGVLSNVLSNSSDSNDAQ